MLAGKLYGRINWRIPKGSNDDFLERTAIQTFDQQDNPAVLFNHNNECVSSLVCGLPTCCCIIPAPCIPGSVYPTLHCCCRLCMLTAS